jgi:hypothetical protein
MNEEIYKDGIINAIKILDDEVQLLRAKRNREPGERVKESYNNQILSHILSIQHLRETINDVTEEE